MTVLATSPALLLVLPFLFGGATNSLLIRHLGSFQVDIHAKLFREALHNNIQMHVSHTGDNNLLSFRISFHAESRILLQETGQPGADLFFVALGFGFYGKRDNWLGKFYGRENYGVVLIAECIAGTCHGQLGYCPDIADDNLIRLDLVFAAHEEQASDPLRFSLIKIENLGIRLQCARVNAEIVHSAYIGVGQRLKDQRRQGFPRISFPHDLLIGLAGQSARCRRPVNR